MAVHIDGYPLSAELIVTRVHPRAGPARAGRRTDTVAFRALSGYDGLTEWRVWGADLALKLHEGQRVTLRLEPHDEADG